MQLLFAPGLLYFTRGAEAPGIWSIPVAGGQETLVLPHAQEAFWDVADEGIAFILTSPALSPEGPTLRFLSFATQQVSTLGLFDARPTQVLPGLSVSRDGRSVVWTRLDRADRDLMLVDPWRD